MILPPGRTGAAGVNIVKVVTENDNFDDLERHEADGVNVGLAWTYVALRVVHSLIQCTRNIIMARFTVFALSTIALAAMAIRTALAVF